MASRVSFTYDPKTVIGRTRLYSGDTDPNNLSKTGGDRTRTDAEIDSLLTASGQNTLLAAARLLEGRAAEYAQAAVTTEQGQLRQDFTHRSEQCMKVAQELRNQSGGSVLKRTTSDPEFTMQEMEAW